VGLRGKGVHATSWATVMTTGFAISSQGSHGVSGTVVEFQGPS
jgi:hypothetical protein